MIFVTSNIVGEKQNRFFFFLPIIFPLSTESRVSRLSVESACFVFKFTGTVFGFAGTDCCTPLAPAIFFIP